MKRAFRVFGGILGVGVTIQYLYWAAVYAGYGIGYLVEPPHITADWYVLGFAGAAFLSGDRALRSFGVDGESRG